MEDTSVSLLERIAASNLDEDWQRLLGIYRPFVEKQVRAYPQLAHESDDVVQEICLVLMRELPGFQRQRTGSFRKWFRQITVNQLRIAARKNKSRPTPMGDSPDIEVVLDQLLDPVSEAARQWDLQHDQEVLRQVIEIVKREANPLHWRAFQMHVLDDRPVKDVAQELGVTANVVLLAKSRIKKRLQVEAKELLAE